MSPDTTSDAPYGNRVEVISDPDLTSVDFRQLTEAGQPILLKNLVGGWPIVKAARQSDKAAADYLLGYYTGQPLVVYRAPAGTGGKFAYNDELTGFNFATAQLPLQQVFEELLEEGGQPPEDHLYIGSTDLDHFFPGMAADNQLALEPLAACGRLVMGSIWIGNRTTATAHYDMSNNIASCVAGRRRFTLFPPDQIGNLYPGPIEPTPGGQVVSMVDISSPDLERFPRFADAMKTAVVADMEPGDVLVYPAMWWHHVEALAPFNILINHWWNAVPAHFDTPMNAMLQAILSLRDRPDYEKAAWRTLFDYYVFGDPDTPRQHLPDHALGDLASMEDSTAARRLRAKLLNRLNR